MEREQPISKTRKITGIAAEIILPIGFGSVIGGNDPLQSNELRYSRGKWLFNNLGLQGLSIAAPLMDGQPKQAVVLYGLAKAVEGAQVVFDKVKKRKAARRSRTIEGTVLDKRDEPPQQELPPGQGN